MSRIRGVLSDTELRSPGGRLLFGLIVGGLVLFSLIAIFPLFFAFVTGLKGYMEIRAGGLSLIPKVAHWENYLSALSDPDLMKPLWNSLVVGVGGVAGNLLVSTLAAYSLARLKPIGGRAILFSFLILLMIPSTVSILFLYATIVDLKLLNSFVGLWLFYAISPLSILLIKNTFEQVPQDLYDAAVMDGASAMHILWFITLPLSHSIFWVLAILGLTSAWGDFLLPRLVLADYDLMPVSVLMSYINGAPLNWQMIAAFVFSIPPVLIALVLQRHITRGISISTFGG